MRRHPAMARADPAVIHLGSSYLASRSHGTIRHRMLKCFNPDPSRLLSTGWPEHRMVYDMNTDNVRVDSDHHSSSSIEPPLTISSSRTFCRTSSLIHNATVHAQSSAAHLPPIDHVTPIRRLRHIALDRSARRFTPQARRCRWSACQCRAAQLVARRAATPTRSRPEADSVTSGIAVKRLR